MGMQKQEEPSWGHTPRAKVNSPSISIKTWKVVANRFDQQNPNEGGLVSCLVNGDSRVATIHAKSAENIR